MIFLFLTFNPKTECKDSKKIFSIIHQNENFSIFYKKFLLFGNSTPHPALFDISILQKPFFIPFLFIFPN